MSDAPDWEGGVTDAEPCPYLPGRRWRNFVLTPEGALDPADHERLLDMGFRRMGQYLYHPICDDCDECRPLRIDVAGHRMSRSQRRARRRNEDLDIAVGRPQYGEEKRRLLERYLEGRHTGPMTAEEESMREFMYAPVDSSLEFLYRKEGRLVGVGLVDLTPQVVSSVYFFFDPAESRRSLGIYSMLVEIEFALGHGRRFYHPGFYVEGCAAMAYKARLGPAEILSPEGTWRTMPRADAGDGNGTRAATGAGARSSTRA